MTVTGNLRQITRLSLADNSPKEGIILSATHRRKHIQRSMVILPGHPAGTRMVELTVGSYRHVMEVCSHKSPPFPGSPDLLPFHTGVTAPCAEASIMYFGPGRTVRHHSWESGITFPREHHLPLHSNPEWQAQKSLQREKLR